MTRLTRAALSLPSVAIVYIATGSALGATLTGALVYAWASVADAMKREQERREAEHAEHVRAYLAENLRSCSIASEEMFDRIPFADDEATARYLSEREGRA